MARIAESKPATYRILIVDDDPIARRGLRDLVAEEPDLVVCGEAQDDSEAMQQLGDARPDVVLLELALRKGHGLHLIRKIRAQNQRIKILVSTMHDESLYAARTMRAGAAGYINKQESPERIIEALRQVLRGETYLKSRAASRRSCRLPGNPSLESDPIDGLSDRELEVFESIGRGLSTKQIAKKLGLSRRTIEVHCEGIKAKLNLDNRSQMNHYATQWVLHHG